MSEKKSKRGCLKYGCGGCGLAVLILGLCILGGFLMGAPEPDPRDDVLAQAVTKVAAGPGRIRLDLTEGTFSIEPAPAGEPLRVAAEYDASIYELEELFEPAGEKDAWIYSVRIESQLSLLRRVHVKEDQDGCQVRVHVPRDLPVVIEARLSKGESRIELGGLDLRALFLDLSMGEHAVAFSEPTASPLEALRVNGTMGEVRLSGLGNASPVSAPMSWSMGELTLGLDGEWRGLSDIHVEFAAGGVIAVAPADAPLQLGRVEMFAGGAQLPEDGGLIRVTEGAEAGPATPAWPSEAPAVRLSVDGKFGEFQLRR